MEGEATLQMLAEASVAFAGFTGVVAVLGSRASGRWRPVDVIRFRGMVASSLATLGFSLLPILMHHLGVPPETYWSVSSGVLALFLPMWLARIISQQRRHRVGQDPEFVPGFRVAALAVVVIAFVTQLMHFLGVGLSHSFGGYLIGLFAALFICGGMFVLLLRFVRFESPDS